MFEKDSGIDAMLSKTAFLSRTSNNKVCTWVTSDSSFWSSKIRSSRRPQSTIL